MYKKAFVLLSGGMDSTTCLHKAIVDGMPNDSSIHFGYGDPEIIRNSLRNATPETCNIPWVEAVSVNYGQRHKRELLFAAKTCKKLGIKHTILDVGDLLKGKEILLSADSVGEMEMVHQSYDDIKGVSPSYVPFRNGLLLSAITAHAQKYVNAQIADHTKNVVHETLGRDAKEWATLLAKDLVTIYYGAHAEDAANWAYPDCTPEFNGSMANAIYTGSYNTIRLATPLQWLEKHQIVQLGHELGVSWENTWSCYDNGEIHCGKCPTCQARKSAFLEAGIEDPTEYAA